MRMKQLIFALAFCLQLSFAQAELRIEVTQGVDNAVRIAVVPFDWRERKSLPEDISEIVSSDLQLSGRFETLPVDQMLSMPASQDQVHFRDWRLLKVEYLVIGKLQFSTEGVRLHFELYDVFKESLMSSQDIEGSLEELRDMAHYASDEIFVRLTGIEGAFSTQIMYITATGPLSRRNFSLNIADADGHRAKTLFSSDEPIMSPAWSPDGSKIAYVSYEKDSKPAIYLNHLKTGRKERLTDFPGLNGAPSFSPDGRKLAIVLSKTRNPDIYILDLETRAIRRVTRHRAIDTEPGWIENGKALIFTSNRGGQPQIYKIHLDNLRAERLTFEGDYNARARLLPDESGLVMVHRREGVFHITLLDLKRGRMNVLTETTLDESPSIAPNGSMLIYATKHEDKDILAAVSIDGGVKFKLPSKEGDVREPAWSPHKRKVFHPLSLE